MQLVGKDFPGALIPRGCVRVSWYPDVLISEGLIS
jgi:hypothetical protein